MSLNHLLPVLFAQADGVVQSQTLIVIAATAAVLILPFVIGSFLARSMRMADYGWKIGLILCTLAAAGCIVAMGKLQFGVDLRGGSILIYELEADQTLAGNDEDAETEQNGNAADMGQPRRNRVDQALVQAISERINPAGTKEIVVRPYGDRQIEIIVPETDPLEVEQIKRRISTAGALEFRIVATRRPKHRQLLLAAQEMAADPIRRLRDEVVDDSGERLGKWVRVARVREEEDGVRPFKVDVSGDIIRNAATGEILDVPAGVDLASYLKQQDVQEIDVLMSEDDWDVTGDYLASAQAGYDEMLNPNVRFRLKGVGAKLFQELTREYSPDKETNQMWNLGIVLDNNLLSAPVIRSIISDSGEISGRFTQEEVDFLVGVLQAGKLPATLQKSPITENQIGSTLGLETIRKGTSSIMISLGAVLVFILIYYRFAGLVASLALLANLLFTLALMILMRAPLTLPGLAGLVLTVGMSVDANVLIFERIREELHRGAALRMAIRNGFSRATTTIVDANLTTLITGIVLYWIGTDQIRGFAVTLILGILMSMFTAIFCARVVFDIAERKRLLTKLNMMQLVSNTHVDFVRKQGLAIVVSLVLIGIGIVGVIGRGPGIFDIDFLGGVSVVMTLEEPMPDAEVRQRVDDMLKGVTTTEGTKVDYTLTHLEMQDKPANSVWKIDASLEEVETLQELLDKSFPLAHYQLKVVESVRQVATRDSGESEKTGEAETEASESPAAPADENATKTSRRTDLPPETWIAALDENPSETASDASDPPAEDKPAEEKPAEEAPAADEKPTDEKPASDDSPADQPSTEKSTESEPAAEPKDDKPAETPTEPNAEPANEPAAESKPEPAPTSDPESSPESKPEETPATETPATEPPAATENAAGDEAAPSSAEEGDESSPKTVAVFSTATLSFPEHPISAPTLIDELQRAAEAANAPVGQFNVAATSPAFRPEDNKTYDEWNVNAAATPEQFQEVLNALQRRMETTPIWMSSSKIGGKVAGDTQVIAIGALMASLLGIVAYIWFRFQKLTYGLAAVVALVHDVLITLGAIAVSYWLAGALGFLLVDEFKISLPVVAAFLTLIGYSLNDTIVVFDRIREVKGKSPNLTGEMINTSINQTLSRTMLTSMTTLLVVLILYFLGGEGIHGFAFALVIGVIVGTYSSIFVASPILLWMTNRSEKPNTSAT